MICSLGAGVHLTTALHVLVTVIGTPLLSKPQASTLLATWPETVTVLVRSVVMPDGHEIKASHSLVKDAWAAKLMPLAFRHVTCGSSIETPSNGALPAVTTTR